MTKTKGYDYIIVGAGIAGMSAAETIASQPGRPTILLINNEPRLPYKRTKINKNIEKGFTTNEFALKNQDWFAENNIDLLQHHSTGLNTKEKTIHAGDQSFTYHKLLLATGSRPRSIGCDAWDNMVLNVRTASQVEAILQTMQEAHHYFIIGGGAEGIETAEQLVKAGKQVTLVDRNKYLMHNFLPIDMGERVKNTLSKNGILVINPTEIKAIRGGQSLCIDLSDETITADVIISCIGHTPNIELAQNASIKTNRGIIVDQWLQTSAPDVFAAGDAAEHPEGKVTGLWHAAGYQGKIAALNMMGQSTICERRPYRFKTEIFGDFYFAGGIIESGKEIIEQTNNANIKRYIARTNNQITGIASCNETRYAQLFQQALMERWTLEELESAIKKLECE